MFISYVEEDSRLAAQLTALLSREEGFTTWRYETDASAGRNYLAQTREQIERCDAFLVILSPSSMLSKQVELEIIRAHECGKPMMPVLANLSYQEFGQHRPEWQQAMGGATAVTIPEHAGLEAAGDRLLSGLRDLLGHTAERDDAWSRRRRRRRLRRRVLRLSAIALLVIGVAVGGWKTYAWSAGKQRLAEANQFFADAQMQYRDARDDEAMKSLDRAIELMPNFWDAYVLRAELQLRKDQPAAALADLDAVLAAQPDHPEAVWLRGWALRDLDRLEEAVASLTTYIDRKLGLRDAEIERADINMTLERYDDAERDFQLYIQKHPNRPEGYVGRGFALLARVGEREPEEVLADFQQWLSQESFHDLRQVINDCSFVLAEIDRSYAPALACRGIANVFDGWIVVGTGDLMRALESNQLTPELRERCHQALSWANALPRVTYFNVEPLVDVYEHDQPGLAVVAEFEIEGAIELSCAIEIAIADSEGRSLPSRRRDYATIDGYLGVISSFTPTVERAVVRDYHVFMPYAELPCTNGQNFMQFYASLMCGRARLSETVKGPLLFKYPPRAASKPLTSSDT